MSSIFDCLNRRGGQSVDVKDISTRHGTIYIYKNLSVYFLNSKAESKYDVAVNQPHQQKHKTNNI